MALLTVPMRCCDDPLILKGVDRHEKVGKASLNPLHGGKICMDGVDMATLDVEDVYHSAGYSCCSVCGCDSTAIRSMHILMRRSVAWRRLAVWRVCRRGEEKLLVNNRQMMCVIGLVRKERIVVTIRHLLLLFVDKTKSSNEESEYPFQYSNNE